MKCGFTLFLSLTLTASTWGVEYIGNPNAENKWSTISAVTVRAGHERSTPFSGDSRWAYGTINGSGLDAGGEEHDGINPNMSNMWLSQAYHPNAGFGGNPPPRGGTVPGGHWIEFAFDKVYAIDEMLIWNYAEICCTPRNPEINPDGSRRNYRFSSQGLRQVTIQYSTVRGEGFFGSENPADWQTIFVGELNAYHPREFHTVNNVISFNGALVKYVVITSSDDPRTMNWIFEKTPEFFPNLDAGLAEVRFSHLPLPSLEQMLNDLIESMSDLSIHHGTKKALLVKALNAGSHLEKGNQSEAAGLLTALINHAEAQRGKKLIVEQADELITAARAILSAIVPTDGLTIEHVPLSEIDHSFSELLKLTWDLGTLQKTDSLHGPWRDVEGAISPYFLDSESPCEFYRRRVEND
jgi:hypothetical protein